MKTLVMTLMIAGLMATVGIYAATFTGGTTTKTLGGSGTVTVGSPSTVAVSVDWTVSGANVTGGVVNWTPVTSSDYTITVATGGQSGTFNTGASSGTTPRNDAFTLGVAVAADLITDAVVTIEQN